MPQHLKAKIKDRDQFRQVFPLPVNCRPNLSQFINSIIGQTIPVRKVRSMTGSFCYVSEIDPRWVIMPNWIEYFDTEELVTTSEGCIGLVVYWDGTVIVLGR
jgi:hypothetical protein